LATALQNYRSHEYPEDLIKVVQMNTLIYALTLAGFFASCGTETVYRRNNAIGDSGLLQEEPIAKVYSSDAATFLTQQNKIVGRVLKLQRYPAYSIVNINRLDHPGKVATLYVCETSACYSFTGMNISSFNLDVGSEIIFTAGRFWGSYFWKIENATVVSKHQNLKSRFDVNNDGCISAIDILVLANLYNSKGSHKLDLNNANPTRFVDINGDGYFSPIDLLQIYNVSNGNTFNTCYR
jgi:hypothetical protein